FRGGRRGVGEDGAGSGVGAAEADDAAGADVAGGDALSVGVGAVGAVLVLEGPVAVRGAEHRVVPGDPGVVDDDVAQRVASDVVVADRGHPGGSGVGLQDELGCRRSLRHAWILPIGPFGCPAWSGVRAGQPTGMLSTGAARCMRRVSTDSASSSYSVVSSPVATRTMRPAASASAISCCRATSPHQARRVEGTSGTPSGTGTSAPG